MKLDKIAFAKVVAHIANMFHNQNICDQDIAILDDLIDIQVPVQDSPKINPDDLDQLLMLMAESTRKIEAIKLYRQFTGAGLRESKIAVERYWIDPTRRSSKIMLDNMRNELKKQLDNVPPRLNGEYILNNFTASQLAAVNDFINSFE